MEFILTTDMATRKPIVGVWQNDIHIANIYECDIGLKVVSEYLDGVEHGVGEPLSMVIRFTKTLSLEGEGE